MDGNELNETTEQKKAARMSDLIFKHRMYLVVRALIMVAIVGILLSVFWVQQKRHVYTDYEVKESFVRNGSSSSTMVLLADKILSYNHDGANCMDTQGKLLWNQAFEMQDPILALGDKTAAIGDYDGNKIYVMNTSGPVGSIATNLPIKAISVSDTGVVATVLDDGSITWIYLYDAKGNVIAYFKTTISQSGYPSAVSISPDGKLVMVSYLQAVGNQIKSGVAFFNFGEVGKNEIDNYVSGYDYTNTLVPFVRFMTNSLAFAVADNRLMFYEGSQKPLSKAEVLLDAEVQSVFYDSGHVALITYDPSGRGKYLLTVYNSDGTVALKKVFDLDYKNILVKGENVYIYTESQCLIYSLSGIEKYAGTFQLDIGMIIPGGNISAMTIVGKNTIAEVRLR